MSTQQYAGAGTAQNPYHLTKATEVLDPATVDRARRYIEGMLNNAERYMGDYARQLQNSYATDNAMRAAYDGAVRLASERARVEEQRRQALELERQRQARVSREDIWRALTSIGVLNRNTLDEDVLTRVYGPSPTPAAPAAPTPPPAITLPPPGRFIRKLSL